MNTEIKDLENIVKELNINIKNQFSNSSQILSNYMQKKDKKQIKYKDIIYRCLIDFIKKEAEVKIMQYLRGLTNTEWENYLIKIHINKK